MREVSRVLFLAFLLTLPLTVCVYGTSYFGDDTCSEPLVHRAKLSATSHLQGRTAKDAGIESRSCWSPSADNVYQSLFINLMRTVVVNRIGTKGCGNDFVREYNVQYSTDGMNWKPYVESFNGNFDGDQMFYNTFEFPTIAQFIRINPTRWGERIALQVELYGCDYISQTVSFNGSAIIFKNLTIDRCSPNPCEHGGICKQSSLEFECICDETGYSGAVCHTSLHPPSCQAYRNSYETNQQEEITIDPDGSGPLAPFRVTCQYNIRGKTETLVRHPNQELTVVDGFQEPGSFSQEISYDGDFDQIETMVNRSSSCKQYIEYKCRQSKLFNTPYGKDEPFRPNSWWSSRQNQPMDHWGDSLFGSRKCGCGILKNCIMDNVWCNCDAGLETEQSDGGHLIEKEYLPVRQVRFGDTGTTLDEKQGKFILGPLICEGDALYDNVVTFGLADAALTFSPPNLSHSWDIYFEFKTTTFKAVFLHAVGTGDYIMVELIDGKNIQFSSSQSSQTEVQVASRFNDDKWHTVSIERNRKQARLVVDGAYASLVQSENHGRPMELTSKLVLGASVNYSDGYVGCMRAVTVNGEMLDLGDAVEREQYGVRMGCLGKCLSNPCLNNGSCIEGYNHYLCDCRFTAFKGPICADEIGINMQTNSMVRWDFVGSDKSTIAERLRVGFTTTEPNGFLVGIFSNITGEYLTLMLTKSGHLRLVFDFGFEQQEVIFETYNFTKGQFHDVQIMRLDSGTKLVMKVDNIEPQVFTFAVNTSVDAQFNNIQHLYLGRNESMTEGFIGCISRVEFDDIFPLKILFQENRPKNVRSEPSDLAEDFCGVEPYVHPVEAIDIRPAPELDEDKVRQVYRNTENTESAILGGSTSATTTIVIIRFICVLGLVANSLSAIVLSLPEIRSPFTIVLLGLAFFDSTYLLFVFIGSFTFIDPSGFIFVFFTFIAHTGQVGSVYTTAAIAIERFMVTAWPLESRTRLTTSRSKYIILIVLILSILVNVAFRVPQWIQHAWTSDVNAIFILHLCHSIVYYIIPFVLLLSLNTLIYNNIRKARQERETLTSQKSAENSQTLALLCIVLVFGICYLPWVLFTISFVFCSSGDFIWCPFMMTMSEIGSINVVTSSSVNFIIYFGTWKKFKIATVKCYRLAIEYFCDRIDRISNTEIELAEH